MKINNINSTNFGSGIRIIAAENKHNRMMYYDVCKFIENEQHKFPATFATDRIDLPYVTKILLDKLNELKIIYKNL